MVLLAHIITVLLVLVISCFSDDARAECGEAVWKYCEDRRYTDDSAFDRNINPIMLGPDGTVYAAIPEGDPIEGQYTEGKSNFTLLALDADGSLLWKHKMQSTYITYITVGRDSTVYVVTISHFRKKRQDRLYAFAPGGDGNISWEIDVCYEGEPLPAGVDDSIYISCGNALEGIWRVSVNGVIMKRKSFGASGRDPYDVRFGAIVGNSGDLYGMLVKNRNVFNQHPKDHFQEFFNTTVFAMDPDLDMKWSVVVSSESDLATWFAPYFIAQGFDGNKLLLDGALYDGPVEGYVFELDLDDAKKSSASTVRYSRTVDPKDSDTYSSSGGVYPGESAHPTRFVPSRLIPPIIGSAREMYLVETRRKYDGLLALHPNFSVAWSRPMSLPSRPAIGADGTIYISVLQKYYGTTPVSSHTFNHSFDSMAFLLALDNRSGAIKWKYNLSNANMALEGLSFLGNPCTGASGEVYAVDMSQGCVVALQNTPCYQTSNSTSTTTHVTTCTTTSLAGVSQSKGTDPRIGTFIWVGLLGGVLLAVCLAVCLVCFLLGRAREASARICSSMEQHQQLLLD